MGLVKAIKSAVGTERQTSGESISTVMHWAMIFWL